VPGPSLRGVLRGRSGANGGHGIITKASVKLYPWYGPPEVKFSEQPGLPASGKTLGEVPQGYKAFMILLPSTEVMFEALLRIGKAEIASCVMATGPAVLPYGEGNDEQWAEIQKMEAAGMVFEDLAFRSIVVLLGSDTSRGLEYREKYLLEIMRQLEGVSLPLTSQQGAVMFAGLMWHFGFVTMAFRRTGDFFVSPTSDGSPDIMLKMRNAAVELIQPYIDKGLVVNTGKVDLFLIPSENSTAGFHEENVTYYDPWDPDSLQAEREIIQKSEDPNGPFKSFGVPHLGGGLTIETVSHNHQRWGPIYDNYDMWLRQIKDMLDPNSVGDWSAYIPGVFP